MSNLIHMLPDFPSTKKHIEEHLLKLYEFLVENYTGGFINNLPHQPAHEGRGIRMHYSNNLDHSSPFELIKVKANFTISEVLDNPSLIYIKLNEMARDAALRETHYILESLSNITEKFGNVIKGEGKIRPEDILELFDKVSIEFDTNENPIYPAFIAGEEAYGQIRSALEEIEKNDIYKRKFDEIMIKQKQRWRDRENNRKLVG